MISYKRDALERQNLCPKSLTRSDWPAIQYVVAEYHKCETEMFTPLTVLLCCVPTRRHKNNKNPL